MDEMAAYYQHPHYPYYQPPPPAPPTQLGAPPIHSHTAEAPPLHHHHLAQPYLTHPQPPYGSYAPPLVLQASHDEVRTLFVAGLPEDVKAREIYNLFREFPGYESSHLRTPTETSQPFAFAVFSDQQSAVVAMHGLNGMVFDLEKGSTLYIDLAKSNSRSKRQRTDDERFGSDKKARGSAFPRGTPDSGLGSIHMPGMGNSAYNTIGYPSAQRRVRGLSENQPFPEVGPGNFDGRTVNETAANLHNPPPPGVPQNAQNATSCPTLFVANLGPTCTEQELIQVFSRCPGFLKLKMQNSYGAPVAFVDFKDTACSSGAMNHLQGTILYSSPAGEGMRLQYAKSRMGMRKKSR